MMILGSRLFNVSNSSLTCLCCFVICLADLKSHPDCHHVPDAVLALLVQQVFGIVEAGGLVLGLGLRDALGIGMYKERQESCMIG